MLILITLGYCGIVWLVFMKLKLLPWNKQSKGASALVGVAMIIGILILLAQGSPQATGGIQIMNQTVELRAYSTGIVSDVHVDSYERVKKGAPLVTIDPDPYKFKVQQAKAQLQAALKGYEQMEADVKGKTAATARTHALVEIAETEVTAAESSIQSIEASVRAAEQGREAAKASVTSALAGVERAEADVERNVSNVKTAELQITRIRDLVAQKVETQAALDGAENKRIAAIAGLKSSREALNATKAALDSSVAMEKMSVADIERFQANELTGRAALRQTKQNVLASAAQVKVSKAALQAAVIQRDTKIDGEHTTIVQARQALATAEYNLAQTVIKAPADGFVVNMGVREGDVLKIGTFGAFVVEGRFFALATFSQATVKHVKPGHIAELALASQPGVIIEAEVQEVVWASGESQVQSSGAIPKVDQIKPAKGVIVRFQLKASEGFEPKMGQSGTVAIYTDHGKAFAIIRKIMLRMTSLMYYLG